MLKILVENSFFFVKKTKTTTIWPNDFRIHFNFFIECENLNPYLSKQYISCLKLMYSLRVMQLSALYGGNINFLW